MARPFVHAWLGPDYVAQSASVVQWLAAGFLFNTLANIPLGFLQGIGRADVTAKFHMAEALAYIPLAVLFVTKWGVIQIAQLSTLRGEVRRQRSVL